MNNILLILMTVINPLNAGIRISDGASATDIIFWGALFLWGVCAGLWAQKNLS